MVCHGSTCRGKPTTQPMVKASPKWALKQDHWQLLLQAQQPLLWPHLLVGVCEEHLGNASWHQRHAPLLQQLLEDGGGGGTGASPGHDVFPHRYPEHHCGCYGVDAQLGPDFEHQAARQQLGHGEYAMRVLCRARNSTGQVAKGQRCDMVCTRLLMLKTHLTTTPWATGRQLLAQQLTAAPRPGPKHLLPVIAGSQPANCCMAAFTRSCCRLLLHGPHLQRCTGHLRPGCCCRRWRSQSTCRYEHTMQVLELIKNIKESAGRLACWLAGWLAGTLLLQANPAGHTTVR